MTEQRLRIVRDGEDFWCPTNTFHYDEARQLELDLGDDPVRRILVAAMDRLHGLRLHALLVEIHPVLVLDLRNTIRFDLPGTSRNLFLQTVSKARSSYMRAPMEWHRSVQAPVHIEVNLPGRLRHEVIEKHEGNLMLLVNKPEQALHVSSMLNVTLSQSHLTGWDIEQAM